jgi:hypothetical protein
MLQVEYLRLQFDVLLRLSEEIEKSEVSGKLQEMADELRIMVAVADVTSLAADLDRERAYAGARYCYPLAGNDNGSGNESEPPARTFSFTFLRSRRRARRASVA